MQSARRCRTATVPCPLRLNDYSCNAPMSKSQLIVIEPDRDPHVPTTEGRDLVCRAVACGLDELAIAYLMNLEPLVLRRHYRFELDHGTDFYVARVGSALIDGALRGDVNAQRLFLMSRGRWTLPTGEESRRAVDKTKLAERKQLMDAIVSRIRPMQEATGEKVGSKQRAGGK
jgi:hypothetical protein